VITCQLNDLSVASADSISRAVVDVNVTLTDASLLILTNEAKVSATNYPDHIDRERTEIVIPPNAIADIVFVVDTTKSMDEEINAVIKAIEKFIQEQVGKGGAMPKVILVEFKDNVTFRTFTDDMDKLLKEVRSLTAEGGGLCPEASAEAFELAIDHTKAGGIIMLITDASPYPDTDMAALLQRAKDKGINLKYIPSGDCGAGTTHWNDVENELGQ
jgi:Mg-chelatase subunit ChlD